MRDQASLSNVRRRSRGSLPRLHLLHQQYRYSISVAVMSLRERTRPGLGIIEPCLPSPAKAPPSGPGWLHEIKHDGFRILAQRDPAGVRLITRNGNDFTSRFPFIEMAIKLLPVRSCLIDGEAVVCDENGLAVFDLIRNHRRRCGRILRIRLA
jgi:ATP-dependent DNA ligase